MNTVGVLRIERTVVMKYPLVTRPNSATTFGSSETGKWQRRPMPPIPFLWNALPTSCSWGVVDLGTLRNRRRVQVPIGSALTGLAVGAGFDAPLRDGPLGQQALQLRPRGRADLDRNCAAWRIGRSRGR